MKIAIYTLGCKVNQYETQAMEQALTGRGHTLASFEEQADAYIINTCTVTAVSDKKSRQMIRRARKQSPSAVVAVCGCYAQTKPDEIRDLDVDLISGRYIVDAKSIMGIFSLDLLNPITLNAHSDDCDQLFADLERFIVK